MVEKFKDNEINVDRIRDAVTAILKSAATDLTDAVLKEELAKEGQKRLLFPDGINFIAVSLLFDPTKLDFNGSLTISSQPIKTSFAEPKEATAKEPLVLTAQQA